MKLHVIVAGALAGMGLVAACAPTQAPDPFAETCGADRLQGLIGGTEAAAMDALEEPGRAVPVVRFISPGDAVTMDFRADRLNVGLDLGGIVTRVYCG